MTKSPRDFINELLDAIKTAAEEEQGKREVMNTIHADFDIDLADAMARWMETQDVKIATVMATLAHMLGAEYYYNSTGEEDVCHFSKAYSTYAHHIAHCLWAQHGPPRRSKKSS